MNLTEQYRARTLAFIMPHSVGPTSGWKGYVLRATILGIGFGTYILLFKKKDSPGVAWSLRRSQEAPIAPDRAPNSKIKEHSDSRSTMTYNGEVCPICLGTPKIGLKAPCGHLLCADCLASYCDVRIAPAPPPCPLCRAPLNSVALACDFAILSPEIVDPNVAINVQDWIREYNNQRGLMASGRAHSTGFLATRLALLLNILILFLIVGLIAARLQILSWENWMPYVSVVDIALSVALIIFGTGVWYRNQFAIYQQI